MFTRCVALGGALALVGVVGAEADALTIERQSSPIVFIDTDNGGGAFPLTSAYAAYRVTNDDGVDHGDLYVVIDGFAGPAIGLAPREDGQIHLGRMAAGESRTAYVYLRAFGATSAAEAHVVTVFEGAPDGGEVLAASAFSLSAAETTTAGADLVTTVSALLEAPALGATFTVSVEGDLGEVGATLAMTPAAHEAFPADAFELVAARITLSGSNDAVIDDALVFAPASGEGTHYVAEYTFRVVGRRAGATPISPVAYGGAQGKHTKTNDPGYQAIPLIPAPINQLTLLRPQPFALLPLGGEVTHTLTLVNASATQAITVDGFDDLVDASGASYVNGSTTIGGAPGPDPVVAEGRLSWSRPVTVPPASAVTIRFDVDYPVSSRTYRHASTAWMGRPDGLVIDLTLGLGDLFPALASVTVGLPLDNAPPVGGPFERWVTTGTAEVTVDIGAGLLDLDGGLLDLSALAVLTQPLGADVVATLAGQLVFSPLAPDTAGAHTAVVTVCDDDVLFPACDETTATVWYNDPPTLPAIQLAINVGGAATVPSDQLRDGGSQGEVAPGWADEAAVSGAADGTFGVYATTTLGGGCGISAGAVVYAPPIDVSIGGTDSCFVRLCEEKPADACGLAELTFEVHLAFTPADDGLSTEEDAPLDVSVASLLANDGGASAASFQLIGSTSGAGGFVVLNADATVSYSPPSGYVGEDTFRYAVCNGADTDDCATVTVSISVAAKNHPPTGSEIELWAATGTPWVELGGADGFLDPDGDLIAAVSLSVAPTGAGGDLARRRRPPDPRRPRRARRLRVRAPRL